LYSPRLIVSPRKRHLVKEEKDIYVSHKR